MRRKRRVFYCVYIPNHWYINKLRKFVHDNKMEDYWGKYTCFNSHEYHDCKCLKKNWPIGTIIWKNFWKHGIKYSREYEMVKSK